MVHRVIVEDQSLRWYGRPPKIADNSIEFVQLQFHLPEEWASLLLVAQFTQSETYNMLMTDDRCFLPVELKAGLCKVSLFGYSEGKPVRATSIPLVFQIEESGFVSSAETPIPPTPDLYAQLIEYFSSIAGSGGGGSGSSTINPEDIAAAVEDYLSKNPPEVPDLSDEVERAETAAQRAESANSSAQAALSGAAGAASDASNYAQQAQGFSGSASGSAGFANTRANDADAAAAKAEEAASDAEAAADRAEEAAKVMTDLDTTLTQEGKAADAKAVGDAISKLSGGNAGFVVQDTEPENTSVLWVDTADNSSDEIPGCSGGGIAVTGATVGQTVKISAVDENGVPTAWEPTDFPSGGGGGTGGSSEMTELFRLTTTEEVGFIETGIDLSQYSEVVAMCKTVPVEGTTANSHFDWYLSKSYPSRIMSSLHSTQKRIHVAHITKLTNKKAIAHIGYGTTAGSLFQIDTHTQSAGNGADIDTLNIRIVLDNLNDNLKLGSYGGNTPLIIGTEVLIYGRV